MPSRLAFGFWLDNRFGSIQRIGGRRYGRVSGIQAKLGLKLPDDLLKFGNATFEFITLRTEDLRHADHGRK